MCSNADAHLKGEKVMVKKLRCDVVPRDWVRAVKYAEDIAVQVKVGGEKTDIFLNPENAKKLRKQIKAALAEIEGEDGQDDQEKEEPEYIPHVGEVVEVVENTSAHKFKVGQQVRTLDIYDGYCKFSSLDTSTEWYVKNTDIRPIQNWKPKEGEKVLIVDSTLVPTALTKSCIGGFGTFRLYDIDIDICIVDCGEVVCFNLSDLRPAE